MTLGCGNEPDTIVRELLDRIGSKWSLLIMISLDENPPAMRFTALHKHIDGISQKMLSQTLRELERDGLIDRAAFAETPPRVEYSITPLGESLLPVSRGFADWAMEKRDEVTLRRSAYDSRNA